MGHGHRGSHLGEINGCRSTTQLHAPPLRRDELHLARVALNVGVAQLGQGGSTPGGRGEGKGAVHLAGGREDSKLQCGRGIGERGSTPTTARFTEKATHSQIYRSAAAGHLHNSEGGPAAAAVTVRALPSTPALTHASRWSAGHSAQGDRKYILRDR